MMINKRGERQKTARKKVEHRQRKRQKEKEKVEDIQRQTKEKDRKQMIGKVVYRKRKKQKRIGSEKTKIEKHMFHLENT